MWRQSELQEEVYIYYSNRLHHITSHPAVDGSRPTASSVFYYSLCFNYILKLILHQFIIEGSTYI